MPWFFYYSCCPGFAMNTLAKRMGEGRKMHYIIGRVDTLFCQFSIIYTLFPTEKVFLLILGVALIEYTLKGLVLSETYDTNEILGYLGNKLYNASYPEKVFRVNRNSFVRPFYHHVDTDLSSTTKIR